MLIRNAYSNMQRVPKKCPASVFVFLHLAFWFDPGYWDQKQQLDVAATTAAVLLLLAAAAVLLFLLLHDPRFIAEHDPRC